MYVKSLKHLRIPEAIPSAVSLESIDMRSASVALGENTIYQLEEVENFRTGSSACPAPTSKRNRYYENVVKTVPWERKPLTCPWSPKTEEITIVGSAFSCHLIAKEGAQLIKANTLKPCLSRADSEHKASRKVTFDTPSLNDLKIRPVNTPSTTTAPKFYVKGSMLESSTFAKRRERVPLTPLRSSQKCSLPPIGKQHEGELNSVPSVTKIWDIMPFPPKSHVNVTSDPLRCKNGKRRRRIAVLRETPLQSNVITGNMNQIASTACGTESGYAMHRSMSKRLYSLY